MSVSIVLGARHQMCKLMDFEKHEGAAALQFTMHLHFGL
jgi:hypothetical protein